MPLYEYRCDKCGKTFEKLQKFADAPLEVHEDCGGHVERMLSAPALQFKGSGFYITDYAKGSGGASGKIEHKGESKSDSKSDSHSDSKSESKSSESKSSESKSSDSKSSESKSESKSDSKSESKPTPASKSD